MSGVAEFLAETTVELEPLMVAASTAWWDAATDATPVNVARREHADRALGAALGDPTRFAALLHLRDQGAHDASEGRQLTILHDTMLRHQVEGGLRDEIIGLETEISAAFSRHRATIVRADGPAEVDDAAITHILRSSDDSRERRDAWEASKSVGPVVAQRIRALAHLRNRAARSLGYRDFVALSLASTELSEERLLNTLDTVDRATAAPFARWKAGVDSAIARRFSISPDAVAPWHYDNPFFQEQTSVPDRESGPRSTPHFSADRMPALTVDTYRAIGLDVDAILARSDLLPRSGKNQHAFCADLDRRGDVRVLANIADGETHMSTMLHEFGHGSYFQEVDASLPYVLRDMHMLTTEAIAMLFGRLTHDAAWIRSHGDVDVDPKHLASVSGPRLLLFARWTLVMTHFERGLYADPDGDHDTRWWELVERYQAVRPPTGRSTPDWAAKIHVAVAPVYYHNYLYGEMLASQLSAAITTRFGGLVGVPAAGGFLREEIFRPGHSSRWDHLVHRATGSPLDVAALLADAGA